MIEQGFLKTHFVGRDGFIWWIGQVAPKETWQGNFGSGGETKDSKDIEGFGERYRVRIMGYHTANKDDLPDDELPFATVMYPVTGGAGGDAATTSNIRQGNFVFGFFLDGEDAQQPVIMGLIGYNNYQEVMDAVPSIGFKPFYGLDGKKPSGGELSQPQTDPLKQQTTSNVNGATDGSSSAANDTSGGGTNTTDRNVTGVDGHKALQTKEKEGQAKDPSESVKKYIPSANSKTLPMKGIQLALQKAIQEIENIKKTIRTVASDQLDTLNNLQEEINKKIDIASEAVASAIKWVYQMVEENILKNMDKAFKKVFSMAKPSEQEKVSEKSNQIIDTVACFFRRLFGGLLGMVRDFIAEAIDKVVNVPVCFVEKFTGNVLGFVSGFLSNAMEGITGLISGAVDLASEGLDLAADVMNTVSDILSFLNCDEFPDESPVSEWSHIYGAGPQFGKGDVANILNKAKSYASKAKTQGLEALDTFDFAKEADFSELLDVKSQLDGCITDEFPCGPPNLNIFGSPQGAGAVGNLIINAAGSVIGVDMQSFGVGYNNQARANVIDSCGNGQGAVFSLVFGNVNNAFSGPAPSGPSNPGTPAFSPSGLGFGPFAPNPYPFDNNIPGSQRSTPYSPTGKAYGTPAYGLGPSFSKIGKKAPKTTLGITSSTYNVNFEIETFTIPVAETPANPVVKFVLLQKNTQLLSIDTDFDFTPDDISGKGRLDKNGQVVVGFGTEKFALASKSTIVQNGKELEFQEAFDGGQNQRVIKGQKYLVRGFQFDGEPLQNPIKISNGGKCARIDAVEGATIDTVERQVQIVDKRFDIFNFKVTTDAKFGNGIHIKGLFNLKKDFDGDDLNFNKDVTVELGKVYDVDIISPESREGVRLRTNKDGNVLEMEDHDDNDWTDVICTVSGGTFFDLKDGSTNGQPKNRASCKFRVDKVITFKTVYDDVKTPGVSDDDYNDMVICAKRGKFVTPNNKKLAAEGAVIYILEDDPGPSGPTSPTTTAIPSPGAPALPIPDYSIVSPGPTSGGIPGILTPGPSNNSTFHPFPGSTTLGPGKWVPGPVPPGGGGPHVGPAVFIHDGQLFGELTGKQGAPAPSAVGPVGSFGSNTGGAGGQQPGAIDPGSIPPSWIPGSIGGGGGGSTPSPGGITPAFPANPISPGSIDPGGIGPGDPGGIGGGGGPTPGGLAPIGPITALPPGPGTYYPDNAIGVGPIVGIPVAPGVMVPPDLGGITGPGIGIVDVIVEDGGTGYLPFPDGSTGGDGRTYSRPNDTRIQYSDGVKEIPLPSNNRICVDAGDTVILPYGTEVITEPFDGEGGGELIIGGAPHVMQQPGCFTTPQGSLKPPIDGTYPVIMYLCDVIIRKPGFGYKNTDKVVIEPSMGAAAELVVDKFGRITDVLITKPGEGFQEIPKITVESFTGQNADLLAKLCIDRVRDINLVDQEKVIQVVDCVGKF
jgi:hypothetical protein